MKAKATRRRLKGFTRDVLVYVRTILKGVGQLSSGMGWYDVLKRKRDVQH